MNLSERITEESKKFRAQLDQFNGSFRDAAKTTTTVTLTCAIVGEILPQLISGGIGNIVINYSNAFCQEAVKALSRIEAFKKAEALDELINYVWNSSESAEDEERWGEAVDAILESDESAWWPKVEAIDANLTFNWSVEPIEDLLSKWLESQTLGASSDVLDE